jgi:hypothetical protein
MDIILVVISLRLEVDSNHFCQLVDISLCGSLATTPGAIAKENERLELRRGHVVEKKNRLTCLQRVILIVKAASARRLEGGGKYGSESSKWSDEQGQYIVW